MKELKTYILESNKIEIDDFSKLNGFTQSNVTYDIFNMINDAIDLYDGKLEDITVDDIIDLVDLNTRFWFSHIDGDETSKWLEVRNGDDGPIKAYVLVGGTIWELKDLERFKYKNNDYTILYGITEDGERYCISCKNLIKYLKDNPKNPLLCPDELSIEFKPEILSQL